ncbi:MAG: tetratricopeptide repeat protein [Candidatus Krumholzibacteriia bacterium]
MLRRITILAALVLAAGCPARAEVARSANPHLAAARQAWRQADLDAATAELQKALTADPRDADAHAWMAEALRRQGEYGDALAEAQLALAAEPGHAMALAVMGDLANPQFAGDAEIQDRDECIRLYRAALASDPYDPQGLMGLCVWAVRMGDTATGTACLTAMAEGGIWTEPLMALARWMLESAPPDAILLLNGDADSFPIWILQAQGVRPDVLPCNLGMLNLDDYRGRLALAGLPVPPDHLEHNRNADGGVHTIAMQVLEYLEQRVQDGVLDRPLAYATTVQTSNLPENLARHSHLRGGVFVHDPEDSIMLIDLQETRRTMAMVPPDLMAGAWVSERERSPARLKGNPYFRFNPMVVADRGFWKATIMRDRDAADWYRDLYLDYRKELGPLNGDAHFNETDAEYQDWIR